jgi:ParB family chromosome partitioning protein
VEESLSRRLDTRVRVELRARKGRVIIDFASVEDLGRIYSAMTESSGREGT